MLVPGRKGKFAALLTLFKLEGEKLQLDVWICVLRTTRQSLPVGFAAK